MMVFYPEETLGYEDDDGTMVSSKEALKDAVVGHKIVDVTTDTVKGRWYGTEKATIITLDNGKKVQMIGEHDCCAYTDVREFFLNPELVDHVITGVGTTDGYDTWHVYADMGDVLKLKVDWSCGNPFYYGYGFNITVKDID